MKALGIYKKKSKNDLELPTLYPFKQKIIESLERKKKTAETARKLEQLKKKENMNKLDYEQLENSVAKAVIYEQSFKEQDDDTINDHSNKKENKNSYMKELNRVLEASDVIIF